MGRRPEGRVREPLKSGPRINSSLGQDNFLQLRFRSRRSRAQDGDAGDRQARRHCLRRRVSRAWLRRAQRDAPRFFPRPVPPPAPRIRPFRAISRATQSSAAESSPLLEFRIRHLFRREWIGAVLVEPIQARGGINVPPPEFLPLLRKLCDEHGALLILDEIYTGFGRTGKWFACEHSGVVPDLICLGKALTGGFPLSACVGRADIMDAAWPPSNGEAMHTSTFLGHPVGCAMALAQIEEIRGSTFAGAARNLVNFCWTRWVHSAFRSRTPNFGARFGLDGRHRIGLPDGSRRRSCHAAVKKMLHRGYILLPEGEHANVISFTPPLTITKAQLAKTVSALAEVLNTDKH